MSSYSHVYFYADDIKVDKKDPGGSRARVHPLIRFGVFYIYGSGVWIRDYKLLRGFYFFPRWDGVVQFLSMESLSEWIPPAILALYLHFYLQIAWTIDTSPC